MQLSSLFRMHQSTPIMPMETGPSIGLSKPSSLFATQKTVSTDLGIDNSQSHADPNKLPTEDSNGLTGTFRSSRQTLSSYGLEHRSPYCTPNSSQKDNNTAQHRPLLRQPPTVEQIEGLVSISGSGFERKCIHSPAERHPTVGLSDQNRPIAHPNSSVGDTNSDAVSFINDEKRFDGDEIHPQRASSDVERHAELSENLPSLEGQQSVDNSKNYFSFLSETRDTDFIIRLESIEIQDTEPLDLSSLDVANPKTPTQNKESTSEVKDCSAPAVLHDRNQKWQFTGTIVDKPNSTNQNSDFDDDETFLKIPVTSPSRILNVEPTDVENHSEWTTTHAPAEEEQSVGSFQNYFSTQSKSQSVWKENNFSLGSLSLFSNQPEKDVINPKIPSNPEIPTNEAVCLEISTDTDNLSVEQSSEESVTDDVVWSSSIHHEVFTLRKPGFMTKFLHMQTDEVLPIEQPRSLTSTEQQSFSCSVSYFSLPSKANLCNQVGDSIQSLPSRVSCGEDSLNPNERDSDHCLDGSNEDTSINGSSSMTHDLYLDDLQTLWMKFEIFLRILYLRSTCEEQHFEESTNQFAEDAQQFIIRLLRDSSTRSKIRNENCSLIEEENSHQSLETNIVGQSSKCENVTNTMIPSHSKEAAVSLIDKHSDDGKTLGGTAKDPSISSYSQSQKVALDDNAPLPIDTNTIDTSMSPGHKHRQLLTSDFDDEVLLPIDANMSPGSPHLQLTDDERNTEDFLNHSAPEINQFNDRFKNQLTQSLTQNDCELRISKDNSFQCLDEDLRDQKSRKNVTNSESLIENLDEASTESVLGTCDTDLVERSNESMKDTSIDSYSQSQESNFDDDPQLPIDINMSPGSPHLQLTEDKRHSEVFMNHSAPEIHQCSDNFKDYLTQSTTQNACEWRILRDDSLQGFDADFREQSPWWKYALNSMTLNQHIDTGNLDTSIDRYSQSRELDLNNDAPLPMDTNVNPGSEDLQVTNVERHQYSPPYSTKKYDEHEVQQCKCKDTSQKSSPKRKNSDTMIQESPPVGENSASSTKCIKNENSDNPKDTNDADLQKVVNTDKSIDRCPEIREEFHSDEDATLPMEIELNLRSEHLQLTNVERHQYSPPYSAKKFDEHEVQQCKDTSQKSSPKRKSSDTTIQESPVGENSASPTKCIKNENSDNPKDTNDADLHEGINTDKSIDRCPEIREKFYSDEDATLPMEIELNSRSEHLQSTTIQRHPYSPIYRDRKFDEPEVQRCKAVNFSQKYSSKRNNSDTTIQESPHVDENSASSTKCKKNENSEDSLRDTNDADLHEGVNTDKSIDRCHEIREEFHSDEDATLPMAIELNSRSKHLQSTNIQRHPYSPPYSAKKFDKYEVQQCQDTPQKSSPKRNNSDTTFQESPHVGENSASSTKCKKNENSDSPRDTNDADLHEGVNTDKSIDRCSEIGEKFHSDEDATSSMEIELNTRCRQSTQNMTQNACGTNQESIFLLSKEADIRCRSSSMEIKLSPESPTINNDITNQGMLRAKTGTASKEKPKKSTMKVAENSVSLTQNKEIRIPESLGNKPDEKSSYEPTTDTCIDRYSHMSKEVDSNEDAVVPTESKINPRSQYLQLIDVERHSENSMNYFEAELQQCNNISCNLFPTENETLYIWDNCLEVGRCFENQDGATQRRGTLLEDAAELDENEFPYGSTTDHISMYGDVVTIYGSASQSESSHWLGEQHYEVRLSATVRPIDGHSSLMWDDRMEDDDAPMSGQQLTNSEDNMDSTDTLPNICQLLSSSCVQLRTSFIDVNSFQRDSNPSRHVSLSTEANQNESIPYEMDEEFVTISGSGSLHELFNGSEERRFRFSERVRPYNNRNS